ncbi:TRMT1-like protein isoform X3 [Pleurodeles waltl]
MSSLSEDIKVEEDVPTDESPLIDYTAACDTSIVEEMSSLSEDIKAEGDVPTDESPLIEKHISIVQTFGELEELANITNELLSGDSGQDHGPAIRKSCPLCPEEYFRACHANKLFRHLQNLHWKISVEYEGYRMCVCHLHCSPARADVNGQSNTKMTAHYHCIICGSTVSRRTEMISHLKRHLNKGETKIVFLTGHPYATPSHAYSVRSSDEVLKETDTNVQVLQNYSTPWKSDSFFNPKMKTNRQLIFCALAVLAQERMPLECLDAFGSTGIMGLQWAKNLGSSVKVTINDINEKSVEMIWENCHLNHMKVLNNQDYEEEDGDCTADDTEEPVGSVEITMMDANVLMHLRAFDFIHLDPFGTNVNFLDAAFRNVRNLGVVSLTSTDISSLYGKALHVAKRHYGVNIVRTEYFREMAARIVVGAVARAAGRCNKGIDVLLCVAVEHFILVVVRVLRGPTEADESAKKIRTLIHCQWCEERIFQKDGHMVGENPYQQLPCNCHESMPGKSAIELGPMWSGTIFNTGYLRRMLYESVQHGIDDIQQLLKTLICEAECTTHKQQFITLSHVNQEETGVIIKTPDPDGQGDQPSIQGKRKNIEILKTVAKRPKFEARTEHPCFYYSIHRHSIRGMNSPKLNKFLQYLAQAGFLVSRTHFDPLGVRTNATLAKFKSVLQLHSSAPNTPVPGVQATEETQPAEDVPLVECHDEQETELADNQILDDL